MEANNTKKAVLDHNNGFSDDTFEKQMKDISALKSELEEIKEKNYELKNELMDCISDYQLLQKKLNEFQVYKEYKLMAASRVGRLLTKIFLFYDKIVSSIKKR